MFGDWELILYALRKRDKEIVELKAKLKLLEDKERRRRTPTGDRCQFCKLEIFCGDARCSDEDPSKWWHESCKIADHRNQIQDRAKKLLMRCSRALEFLNSNSDQVFENFGTVEQIIKDIEDEIARVR